MDAFAENDTPNSNDGNTPASRRAELWSMLIAAWLLAVLVAFFIVRILGSGTAQRFLVALRHHRG